jgi:ankyrin repeat protein
MDVLNLRPGDPFTVAAVDAIQKGDVESLKRLLRENPSLATARIDGNRTLLHVATDWPGHFPNGVATVVALIAAGADVNARSTGRHTETPLHWAASSDDVQVLDTLLDHGADIEANGSVIGGGTPLADAVAFGQWEAARRLVELGRLLMRSGAHVTADSAVLRSIFWAAARTSTGSDTTH